MGRKKRTVEEQVFPPLNIVTRDKWNAVPPVDIAPLKHPIEAIVFTHTLTRDCYTLEDCAQVVRDLQIKHMTEQGMTDIQFNWLVGAGGNVFEGRGWHVRPKLIEDHHLEYDGKAVSIGFIGTYPEKFPSDEMFNTSGLICEVAHNQEMLDPMVKLLPHCIDEPEKTKPVTPQNQDTPKEQETPEKQEQEKLDDKDKVDDQAQERSSVEGHSAYFFNKTTSHIFPPWLDELEP